MVKIESIVVDGTQVKERRLILINGVKVPLTEKSFSYFTKLAHATQKGEWIHKQDLEPGFDGYQARYMYRMRQELSKALRNGWGIWLNDKQGNYRLDVAPNAIQINEENLRNHDDYSLRKLFS